MASVPRRFEDLWAPRGTKAGATRRRRANRGSFSTVGGAEQLEQRALLAGVTATYVTDWVATGGAGTTASPFTYGNSEKGVVLVTIDANAANQNGDDVFLRVWDDTYEFSTDNRFPNSFFSRRGDDLGSVTLIEVNDDPTTPANEFRTKTFRSEFDTIVVQTVGLVDGVDSPTFTIIGPSQNVAKSLVVRLTDASGAPMSNSSISIGAPLAVTAASGGGSIGNQFASPENKGGAIYLEAESITVDAAVTSQNNFRAISAIGDGNGTDGVVPAGIAINQAVNVPGTANVTVSGTGFNVNAGGSITNGAGAAALFSLDLQDADARIAGTVNATDQSYFIRPTAGPSERATARTLTTMSASTGVQAGTISGNQLLIHLASEAAAGSDGTVDLQTNVNNLRITSSAKTEASTLDYTIKIANNNTNLLVDAVAASKGDISLSTTGANAKLDLKAAIVTLGSFSLASGVDLTVDAAITSAKNISLVSMNGSVTTTAALKTREGATVDGQIAIMARKNVTINSLVQAEFDGVSVTATTGFITNTPNLANVPSGRLAGTSATLKAAAANPATGFAIDVGTNVSAVTASVTGTGALRVNDNGTAGRFNVASASTANGNVIVKSARSVDVTSVVAGGTGDASVTSLQGDIDLASVIADGNAVTLDAVEFDTDGETVLNSGLISGNAPVAAEINWTANAVVDKTGAESAELYRNIPTISAYRLSPGNITFTADGSTTLKALKTTDGGVNVTSTDGSITATSIQTFDRNVVDTNPADVTLDARGGGVTLGAIMVSDWLSTVSVTAAQGIADDGVVATTGITANTVNLTAANSGVASDIGSAAAPITVSGVATGDEVALTIAKGTGAGAVDASNATVRSVSGLAINASAINSLDIQATGPVSDVKALSLVVSDVDGAVTVGSGRDLIVRDVQVSGGAFSELSKATLSAGRFLRNANGKAADTTVEAHALSLSALSLDGTFAVSNLDSVQRVSAAATGSNGLVTLAFDRASGLTLDKIATLGGNIAVSNLAAGDLLIGANGITAGTATSANTVTLSTGGAIGEPTDPTEGPGTIFAGSVASLTANGGILAKTKAGQLTGTSTTGSIKISQTGNVALAAGGLNATATNESVTLDVVGKILTGPGTITADTAEITATTGVDVRTSVTTLSANSTAGNVTVLETNGLNVGVAGIQALGGTVALTLAQGTLNGFGQSIAGNAVALKLLQAGQVIDVDTSASTLTAATKAGGNITIRNDKSFAVGAAGIAVGEPGADDVTLTVTKGAITAGAGSIKGDVVALSATTGIAANTVARSITAASAAGDIALVQKGQPVTLASVVASAGGVTVTNNDNIAVTAVQAIGSAKNVSIAATGGNKKITLAKGSISADNDTVTLSATGGIDGASNAADADITAGTISLTSSGGDVTTTVRASKVTASALGIDTDRVAPAVAGPSNLDLTILGSKAVFVGTSTGVTLSAAGAVTLRTTADPGPGGLPIVVVASPTSGTNKVSYSTDKAVTFAVSTGAAAGAGSLSQAVVDAGTATVTGGGTTGVAFSTGLTSPIVLTSTLPITKAITLDGGQRLNLSTGTLVAGRAVDIDGSKLGGTSVHGFTLSGAADNSVIRGFAFYGFNKAGGAAINLAPSADNVTITNNLFGSGSTGRLSANTFGILANGAVGTPLNKLAITGNTIVQSTEAGIKLGANVTNATITGNLIGTNSARVAMGNKVGIDLSGTGAGTTIGGATASLANVIANNSLAGIRVTGTVGGTMIRGNEILQNATGALVEGTSANVTVAGNTVTLNTGNGVVVNGTSSNVTVGGVEAADRNFIGTTSTNTLGLGNARNGVVVSSTGTGNVVRNNVILGNGTANVAGDNAGVNVTGLNTNILLITGNTINANRGAGVLSSRTGAGVVSITTNTITSNSGSGVQVSSGAAVVGSAASKTNDATIRANANTINSNARFGVELLAGATVQIVGNSMASNLLAGILNPNLTPAPTITSVTRSAASGQLTVTFSGLTSGQVVHVYAGTAQGRTYLGRFVAAGATGTFTMSLAAQQAAGVSAAVFTGAPITATRTSVGGGTQNTSAFAAVRTITRVA